MNDTYNRIFHKYNHHEILIKDDIDKLIFSTVLKRKKKIKEKKFITSTLWENLKKKKIKEKELIPYFWSTLQGHPYNTITSYVFLGFQVILAEQLPRPFV